MANFDLAIEEKKYLQARVALEFARRGGDLKRNTDRKSYFDLSEDINLKNNESGFSASEAQLRDLFVNDKKLSFRDYFIQACYVYFYDKTRQSFFREKTEMVKSWRIKEEITAHNKTESEPSHSDKWYDAYLWYANASAADEAAVQEKMKTELIDNEVFMHTICDLADALKKGFDTEGVQKSVISLVNMNDLDKDAAGFYTHSGYQFYTDMTAWVQTNVHKNNGVSDDKLPQKLFGDYAKTIVQRRNALSRPAFPEGACLSKFLGLADESIYLPIILLAAFKADISDDDSTELMACYPSYDNESTNLTHKNYSMTNRTWWQDAFDKNRRKNFVWSMKTKGNTQFQIGLSRPFPSVRKNMPNERGLWLDIDLSDTPQYGRAKMILSIQFSRKKEV